MTLTSISAAKPINLGKYTEAMKRVVCAFAENGPAVCEPRGESWRFDNGLQVKAETVNALLQRCILDVVGKRSVGIETREARLNAKGRATYAAIVATRRAA